LRLLAILLEKKDSGITQETPRFRWLKVALKLLVTGLCAWYISGKIDFRQAGKILLQANWYYLLPALGLFILSKLISAVRLLIYISNLQLPVSHPENIRLYWLGMFYNLFLPGAISGDFYKVILLAGKFNYPYKKLTAAVILDRFSGLLGLGALLALIAFFTGLPPNIPAMITAAALISIVIYYFILRRFFPVFLQGFSSTLLLGMAVQAVQLVCVYMIMLSLGIPGDSAPFLFIFLLSSAAAVLPFTIGGLGIRELVFLEGAAWFHMNPATAVLISLLFYLVTLFTSVWGVTWVFKNPLNEKGLSDEPLIS